MATITFTKIPYSNPDLNKPGAGAEQWHSQNTVNIPSEGTNTQRLDVYWRFTWARIEKAKDQYDWSYLINILNIAISKRQKVSFGIMSVYHDNEDGVIQYDGGFSSYPEYLHNLMKAEGVKDWKKNYGNSSGWVPNYNSQNYLGRLRALNASLNNLLETGSNAGVKYKDIINVIDVRGYGNYGEWHNGGIVNQISEFPNGTFPSSATLKAIIDAHTQTIPNFQLTIIMTAFDYFLQHTMTSPEVGYYALTTRNTYNKLGWRRDNWGAGDGTGDTYIDDLLIDNNGTWNGVQLKTLIMQVWKYAPVTGEPMNSTSNSFSEFEAQVRKYHAASFGNGNITTSPSSTIKNNFRNASKAAGYRIIVESAEIPPPVGKVVTVKMNWKNEGVAPTYDDWDIVFDLVKNGSIVKSAKSTFKLKLFQPAGVATTAVDNLSFDVPDGTYELRFKVVDPTGYTPPMPIFITAGSTNGSYSLGNVSLSGGVVEPPVNTPPVVSAGPDRNITLPTSTTTLAGSATDPGGSIADLQWIQFEGPATSVIVSPKLATTAVNFSKEGTYKYRLTAKDNLGATSVDEVQVIVNPVITVPPVGKKVKSVQTIIAKHVVTYDDNTTEDFPA